MYDQDPIWYRAMAMKLVLAVCIVYMYVVYGGSEVTAAIDQFGVKHACARYEGEKNLDYWYRIILKRECVKWDQSDLRR